MFTKAVCMSSVLPSCCWLVRQAGPLSMENFLWPGQPGSRHHSTDTLNSTNYYCYVLSKPASKTLIQINSDSCTNVFSRGVNKPTTQQTSHANDFVNVKSHARNKPPISSQSIFLLKLMLSWYRISVSPGRKESTLFLKLTFLFAFRRLVSMVLLVTSISKNDRPFTR